jgi:hypothetical protein
MQKFIKKIIIYLLHKKPLLRFCIIFSRYNLMKVKQKSYISKNSKLPVLLLVSVRLAGWAGSQLWRLQVEIDCWIQVEKGCLFLSVHGEYLNTRIN